MKEEFQCFSKEFFATGKHYLKEVWKMCVHNEVDFVQLCKGCTHAIYKCHYNCSYSSSEKIGISSVHYKHFLTNTSTLK